MSRQSRTARISGTVNDDNLPQLLHDKLTSLYLSESVFFESDSVRNNFLARMLRLTKVTTLSFLNADRLGDYSKLIYPAISMKSLLRLYLSNFSPDSRASKLFAKYSGWGHVRHLRLYALKTEERNISASAYFYWQVISICIYPITLRLWYLLECCVQLFALRRRRRVQRKLQDFRPKSLGIYIGYSRVSVKQLMCETVKAPVGTSISMGNYINQNLWKWFTPSELDFWNKIQDSK